MHWPPYPGPQDSSIARAMAGEQKTSALNSLRPSLGHEIGTVFNFRPNACWQGCDPRGVETLRCGCSLCMISSDMANRWFAIYRNICDDQCTAWFSVEEEISLILPLRGQSVMVGIVPGYNKTSLSTPHYVDRFGIVTVHC